VHFGQRTQGNLGTLDSGNTKAYGNGRIEQSAFRSENSRQFVWCSRPLDSPKCPAFHQSPRLLRQCALFRWLGAVELGVHLSRCLPISSTSAGPLSTDDLTGSDSHSLMLDFSGPSGHVVEYAPGVEASKGHCSRQ
jgi:hypothetical protein